MARSLLQVHALAPNGSGPVLPAVQAADFQLLLEWSDTGEFNAFRALVERGAISFRARSNGDGPREILAGLLDPSKPAVLAAWPELDDADKRGAARAFLNGDTVTSGIETVNERIERARQLFSSIGTKLESADPIPRYDNAFLDEVRTRGKSSELRPDTQDLLGKVAASVRRPAEGMSDRTHLYLKIAQFHTSEESQRQATDFVNAFHNSLVAKALRRPLHTLQATALPAPDNSQGSVESSVVRIAGEDVERLSSLSFTWAEIDAVERAFSNRPGPGNIAMILDDLADRFAERPVVVPELIAGATDGVFAAVLDQIKASPSTTGVIAGAAAGSAASTASVASGFVFAGPFGAALLAILMTAISAAVGNQIGRRIERSRLGHAHQVLSGWGPRLTRP